jgi:hypothetical protein
MHILVEVVIASNCWGLISLSRLEGPANCSFRRFPLEFVSLKANREREKGTRVLPTTLASHFKVECFNQDTLLYFTSKSSPCMKSYA